MEKINDLDKWNVSAPKLAKRCNIEKTQPAETARKKEDIRRKWKTKIFFLKKEVFKIDKMCFEWFSKARGQNIPISEQLFK